MCQSPESIVGPQGVPEVPFSERVQRGQAHLAAPATLTCKQRQQVPEGVMHNVEVSVVEELRDRSRRSDRRGARKPFRSSGLNQFEIIYSKFCRLHVYP